MATPTAPTLEMQGRHEQEVRDGQLDFRVTSGVEQELEEPRIVFDSRTKLWGLETSHGSVTEADSNSKVDRNDIYHPCFSAGDKLMRMANKFREKLNLPIEDITTAHSWTEVENELQSAYSALEGLASRDKDLSSSMGKLKRAFRGLCQHAKAGQTFVSLVPNDAFGLSSILCGGLKIIFTGLSETALYREEVYKALENLPYTLTDHAVNVNISLYSDDDELHRRTASLYVSVFRLLEHLLGWFVKNSFVTGVRLLLDPFRFSEKLKEKLAEIRLASQRWEHQASLLSKKHQNDALQLQYWNTFSQTRMVRDMQTILNRTEVLEDNISRATILESLNPFVQVVVDELEKRLESSQHRRLPLAETPSSDATRSQILTKFLFEPDLLLTDCATLTASLRTSTRPSSRIKLDTNRIAALQSNPCIRTWLTVDESSLLLLNGRTAHPKSASESSIVIAQIVHRLLEWRDLHTTTSSPAKIIPLAFFCGQHRDQIHDPNANPAEAAMSLLLQLIDSHPTLPPDLLASTLVDTGPEDLHSILSSLSNLILNGLAKDTVLVLVLDGLKFFTQPTTRCDQTRVLVDGLVGIYRAATSRNTSGSSSRRSRDTDANTSCTTPIVKFLFSSPTRSEFIEDLFQSHEVAALPRDLPRLVSADSARRRETLELEFPGGGSSRGNTSEGDLDSEGSGSC